MSYSSVKKHISLLFFSILVTLLCFGVPNVYADDTVYSDDSLCINGQEHNYAEKEDIPATCYQEGITVYECTRCEHRIVNHFPRLEHHWVLKELGSGDYITECSLCGAEAGPENWIDPPEQNTPSEGYDYPGSQDEHVTRTVAYYVGGNIVDSIIVEDGETVLIGTDNWPSQYDEYRLICWTTDPEGRDEWFDNGDAIVVDQDYALFAQIERVYRIDISDSIVNGRINCEMEAFPDSDVLIGIIPDKGYALEFISAKTESGSSLKVSPFITSINEETGEINEWTFIMPHENVIIEAWFSKAVEPKYKVTFDVEGKLYEEQIITRGEKAVRPEDPVKDGYSFDGWYYYEELTMPEDMTALYDFNKEVTGNLVLVGKWKKDDPPQEEIIAAEAAKQAIIKLNDDKDPTGAKFAPLKLKSSKQGKTFITLKWTKSKKAVKYVIYGNKCGKTKKIIKLATVKGKSSKIIKKAAGKKLKKGTYYKFKVVALDRNNKVVSTSKVIYVATKGKGNYTKVITKAKNNKVSLKKGKTFKLRAKAAGKNVKKHVGIRYESSNKKIATVSKTGKIKAKKKGSCYIYAYAQNGVFKKIKVTVK